MKKLTITLKDNAVSMESSEPMTLPIVTNLLLTSLLGMMNSAVTHTPKQHKQQVKEAIFDEFNVAASTLLAQFAPDISLRPDLTEDAILQQELQLLSNNSDRYTQTEGE